MHFQRIDADLREHIYLENGYGESFGVTDEQLAPYVGGLLPRDGLLGVCDVIVLPKLQPSDLVEMREGQIVWGWPALRPGCRGHPAGHRPAADPDRVRGDEPLGDQLERVQHRAVAREFAVLVKDVQ